MEENATNLFQYASQSHQELDTDFSLRRTSRKPLEENAVMSSYEALEKEMASKESTIYKGQIVVADGPDTKDSRFFAPWLIKTDSENAKDEYYADRIMTGSYTAYFLEERYVTKYQLGTKYTGVGQWADVKGTEEETSTYTEIFNDYNTNVAPAHEKDDDSMPYLSHAHIEGYGNYADHSYVHVEGSNNMAYARNAHVEGNQNSAYGVASHASGSHTLAKGDCSTTLGSYSSAFGDSSIAGGHKAIARGTYSIALGKGAETNGEGSVAFGISTKSNGQGSLSEGQETEARASASHAEGIKTIANGEAGHAEGINSIANGRGSHAEGAAYTYVDATYSHAEGAASAYANYSHAEGAGITYGNYSHVEGTSTIGAEATYSHAEGNSTIAPGKEYSHSEGTSLVEGNYSHGEGKSTVSGDNSHGEGEGIVDGTYSHAEGKGQVKGNYAHAEGEGYAKGNYAHAEGKGQVVGDYAHAEGTGIASKEYAHAEGSSTTASGQYSHAEGANTTASGTSSHAEGYFTIASNNYAHAEGNNTRADGLASHVEGNENEITSYGNYAHVEGKSNLAKGEYSHIEGQSNESNAPYVHIEGQSNIAANTATASHIEGLENNVAAKYAHAEGRNTYIDSYSTYSHGEGYGGSAYGEASHVEGFMSHARGDYSHASGFCTVAPNSGEFSGGTYNRAYTSGVQFQDGVEITSIPNEFARLGGKYVAGRYPTGIDESNAGTEIAMYDASYETIFTIGNGSYDNQSLAIGPLETKQVGEASYDAGQYVKKYSRHNIMDIRKNGQMYYDGGMIVGGEIVAPMSYSYVASLGPTAYFTTIMAALLTQPEYYRPTFSNAMSGTSTVEIGSTNNYSVAFSATNVAYETPQQMDPIYGISLGNMLGYSTGITEINYSFYSADKKLAASKTASSLTSVKLTFPKFVHNTNETFGYFAGNLSKPKSLGGGKIDAFAYSPSNASKRVTYTDKEHTTVGLYVGTEDTYTLYKMGQVTYAGATQMYFQQLAEKGTYIGAAGVKPHEKFNQETWSPGGQYTINGRYKYYWGTLNKKYNQINKAGLPNTGSAGWIDIFNAGNTKSSSTITMQGGYYCAWFAVPAGLFEIARYNHAAVPANRYFYYHNGVAPSALDTGLGSDKVSSACPLYDYITTNTIGSCKLKYHVYVVFADKGFSSGTWAFAFKRNVGRVQDTMPTPPTPNMLNK